MKVRVTFEDGELSILLTPETDAEKRMVGAVIDQPDREHANAHHVASKLVKVSLGYDGHWTNKAISSMRIAVYKSGMEPK